MPTNPRTRLVAALLTLLLVTSSAVVVADVVAGAKTQRVAPVQSDLTAEAVTYDGEVAFQDSVVTIRGQSARASEVVVVFVDRGADTVATSIRVSDDGSFEQNVELRDRDGRLGGGDIAAFVVSPGSDGVFGRTGIGPDTVDQFVALARNLQRRGLTAEEVVQRLRADSVGPGRSDDRIADVSFRLTGARVEIRTVSPAGRNASAVMPVALGQTMSVSGVTNRRPDVANVSVSVVEGPDTDAFGAGLATDWDGDGVWTAELEVPADVAPGEYTLEATDGDATDSTRVRIVAETPTPTVTVTESASPTSVPGPPERPQRTRTRKPVPPTTSLPPPGGSLFRGVEIFVAVFVVSLLTLGFVFYLLRWRRRRRHPPRL